ncbi:hypothetical protein DUI87_29570 [Hirundo rustica rustica]|uniref:ribonuclease H n=1 Tax=Hirundo rustica rustica TaxID=333673 RepID=A0A3M0J534_HIRRU|nr:hypothetical protein DUI87_29570 [Hirundo rustica rustica]
MHQPSPVPSVSPVVYKGSRGGQRVRAIHHPFPQSTIRDLCKAHRDYGRDSPCFRGLLRSDLDAAVVIPADLKQLFSCLLDSTEFKLWVAAWRQQLREALPSLLQDPETAVDDNGNPLTLEHLMGEGRWADPSDQTSDIPIKALQIAREHAVSAFFGMVPDGPVVPYYKIMQGAKESFTKFVERLTRAIEVQVMEVAPILVTSSRHEPYRLRLTEALHLRTVDWTFLSINTKEQGAWPVQGKELVIIGDCKYTPQEVEILPGVLVNDPGDLVLWLRCTHPPTFIPKGQVIAQVIPTRGPNNTPVACPVQAITEERPRVDYYKEPLLGRDLMSQWGVKIDIPDPSVEISAASIDERPTKKLNWLTNKPVWVEQWPLSKPKLKALEELVKEQLAKGHIVETDSPWNSPVFVIQKPGKDKWRLLQDLRQINNVIEDMGSLQPGMPSPTMLPQNWQLAVIDIKDCFFQIPLHPDDAPRFAFSVPTTNREAPRRRYHWRVLPQGMKNSPVICQWYVASLLSPVRAAVGQAIIYHYMDDVLVCAPNDDMLSLVLGLTVDALVAAGFELQEEKVQRMPPWKYLGLEIGRRTIVPQKLAIRTKCFSVEMELAQTGFFTLRNQHLILRVLVALSLSLPVDGWVVPQPKANVWATLAKAMNQDHICLLATSANNPLSTCLVGIPFRLNEFPPIFLQKMRSANQVRSNYLSPEFHYNTYLVRNPFAFWVQYLQGLLSLSSDPTDLELLGSVNASFCIKFVYNHPPKGQEQNYRHVRPVNMPDDWCEDTVEVTRPTSFGINHVTMPSEEDHEEEGLELEEVLEGTPEDEERNLDEEEHRLGTQRSITDLPPPFQSHSS